MASFNKVILVGNVTRDIELRYTQSSLAVTDLGLAELEGLVDLRQLGLTETEWGDGPTDGRGAMVGAWWCEHEAARHGVDLLELELMRDIRAYNEVDCRAMAAIMQVLRSNH